jgi:hypothetical protein
VAKPAAVGSTWKLDADDDDNDLIEDDALLEKEDLAKPDAGTHRSHSFFASQNAVLSNQPSQTRLTDGRR